MMEKIGRITSNAHTHTTWCDGKNTAEEMVLAAISSGFSCLGFSGHSETWFDTSYAMSEEETQGYRREVLALKEKYRGQIDVMLGIEWDGATVGLNPQDYDYTIGSCHYLHDPKSDRYYAVDYTKEELKDCCREVFDGDGLAMAKAYYDGVTEMVKKRKPTIVGHLDLIRKLNAENRFFDEKAPEYMEMALEAARVCVESGCIIEVNTGGIYKGYRSTPYPAKPLLCHIAALGGRITINSDAHDTKGIDFMFSQALDLLKQCGFTTLWQLTGQGMREFQIG